MTDVPRRSYPLVVPPPGGFEDAVRRGRRMRRRKAGGTTGAALALAGAIAYSSITGGPATTGLEQTHNPYTEHTRAPGGEPSPTPEETQTPGRPDPGSTAAPTRGPVAGPVTGPTSTPGAPTPPVRTPRPTRGPTRGEPYAPRPVIVRHDPELAGTSACLPGEQWCAYADVQVSTRATGTTYTLVYGLCRSVDASRGSVQFDRVQQADYVAIDTRDDDDPSNDDTVWTYSAGQPVVPASSTVEIDPGYCVEWTTDWNGYDDFERTPPDGRYLLRARSTGTSSTALPSAERSFQHK